MKRFIDIRGQGTGYRFAFWDTVRDQFEDHQTSQAWDTFADFEQDCVGNIDRYRAITPEWAFTPPTDDASDEHYRWLIE